MWLPVECEAEVSIFFLGLPWLVAGRTAGLPASSLNLPPATKCRPARWQESQKKKKTPRQRIFSYLKHQVSIQTYLKGKKMNKNLFNLIRPR